MSTRNIKIFFILAIIASSATALDFTKLPQSCLQGNDFDLPKDVECTTGKGVKVTKITSSTRTFYCIQYEKNSGDKKEFDVLAFDLRSSDYDLQFVSFVLDHMTKHRLFSHCKCGVKIQEVIWKLPEVDRLSMCRPD